MHDQLPRPLARITALALRRPRRFLAVIAVLAVASGAFGAGGLQRLSPFSADNPGSESVHTRAMLGEAAGIDPDFGLIARVETPAGVNSAAARTRVRRVRRALDREPLVTNIQSYLGTNDPTLISPDRRTTYVAGGLRPVKLERQIDVARRVERRLDSIPGVQLGGRATFYANGNDTARRDLVRAELFALPVLILLALWIFRGILPALLPLGAGAVTVGFAFGALRLLASEADVSVYALNIVSALGLGLAVDYSLLLLARYREEALAVGYGTRALQRALRGIQRTIVSSSLTVAFATATLLVFPQPFLRSIAAGGMFVAIAAGLSALTVVPAILAVLGPGIERFSFQRWREAGHRAARPTSDGAWYRLSQAVMKRPGRTALASGLVLLILATPALGIKLTAVDANVVPKSSGDRQVAEAFAREGRSEPILIAAQPPAGTSRATVEGLANRIGRVTGVATVTRPEVLSRTAGGRDLWRIDALPDRTALSERSQASVQAIRNLSSRYPVSVGGETAGLVDLKQSLASRMPYALALLILLTFFPILAVTRSLLLPLKTIVMNCLTVAATFGLLTLIFQDGRLEGVLDYTGSGALESSVLVLIAAVAFGLVTDYGMFLLARIKENRDRGMDDRAAIAHGLERTGRVVSAAAILLCVALGSLATAQHALVKEVGVGCAIAVVIDVTLVRALLVPALMRLLGRWNWWAPRPLLALAGGGDYHQLELGPAEDPPPTSAERAPTRYCDARHPEILATLSRLATGEPGDRELALRLFEYVRDEVRYAFGPWGVKASDTLARGAGTCTNKANLLVALLRAAGIPAAYGVLRVDAQHYFGAIAPSALAANASADSTHVYAAAYLDGRWVRCDPSTDAELAELTAHFCRQTQLVHWDGRSDALDFLDPAHVHADLGLQADIDELLDKPARNATPNVLELANDYLRFIREQPRFDDAEALLKAYSQQFIGRRPEWEASRAR